MRIVFVSAPLSDVNAQPASALLEQCIRKLCMQQPGYELIVLPGNELPGMLAFAQKQKQKRAITDLKPDLLVYASPANLLLLQGLPTIALLTAGAYAPENKLAAKYNSSIAGFITDSAQLKKEISSSLKIPAERITTIPLFDESALDANSNSLREAHTSGKEYFFYSGSIDAESQWERVLQAFSQFKKWQQSGLQLLLAGAISPAYNNIFREKLSAYKYRDDVKCIEATHPAKNQLAAAAFSVLSTANTFSERMDIITAFSTGIPVIAHNGAISKDLCGDSALFANFTDARDLSQQMISMYKNEGIYNHLSEKGKLVSGRFSARQLQHELHRALLAAIEQ